MFTGIIQHLGKIKEITEKENACEIRFECDYRDYEIGESIACNGVCLTVVKAFSDGFSAFLMQETLNRTNFAHAKVGDLVNYERALRLDQSLGGHIVSGHIDQTGIVNEIEKQAENTRVRVTCSPEIARQIVNKGSITINGVSLTVTGTGKDYFEVCLIPLSASHTNLGKLQVGTVVNLELDALVKYVARLLQPYLDNPHALAALIENAKTSGDKE